MGVCLQFSVTLANVVRALEMVVASHGDTGIELIGEISSKIIHNITFQWSQLVTACYSLMYISLLISSMYSCSYPAFLLTRFLVLILLFIPMLTIY